MSFSPQNCSLQHSSPQHSPLHDFRRLLLIICLSVFASALCSNRAAADNPTVKVYELHYQLASSVLPTVDGLLADGESANEYNNQLVVNASATTHHQIAALLQEIDTPSRNLLISVRNNNSSDMDSSNIGAQGVIRTGDVYLGAGGPIERKRGLIVRKDGMTVQTDRQVQHGNTEQAQQLRALEGHPAWISTGQDIPYRSYDRWSNPVTDYQNADQGFYVTARIIGNRVQLDISTSNDALSEEPHERRRGVINTQQLQTSVTGAIGEWINIGAIDEQSSNSDSSYSSYSRENSNELTDIAIRVVPVD